MRKRWQNQAGARGHPCRICARSFGIRLRSTRSYGEGAYSADPRPSPFVALLSVARVSARGRGCASGNRTYDDGCRGVGGTVAVPCTSVGEENLLMVNDCFHSESIMVHEFAHAVMNIGVSPSVRPFRERANLCTLACGLW